MPDSSSTHMACSAAVRDHPALLRPAATRAIRGVISIILVAFVLLILAMFGFSSFFQSSGTARTYSRVVDMRQTVEAGDAAMAEAVAYIRQSMNAGSTSAECPDNWRQLLLDAVENAGNRPTGKKVSPVKSRDVFKDEVPPLTLSDVTVSLVDMYSPPYTSGGAPPPYPPQGVLEMSVVVGGAQKIMRVQKTIRQRRVFTVTASVQSSAPTTSLTGGAALFNLLSDPLGTVVE